MVHVFKLMFFLIILQLLLASTVYGQSNTEIASENDSDNESDGGSPIVDQPIIAVKEKLTIDVEICRDASVILNGEMIVLGFTEMWNQALETKEEDGGPCSIVWVMSCVTGEEGDCVSDQSKTVTVNIIGSNGMSAKDVNPATITLNTVAFLEIADPASTRINIKLGDDDDIKKRIEDIENEIKELTEKDPFGNLKG